LATRVWDVRDGDVTEWNGNLDAYLYHLEQIGQPMVPRPEAAGAPARAENERARRQREARERAEVAARTGPLRAEIPRLEERIAALEGEKAALDPQLAAPALHTDFARARPLYDRAAAVAAELERLYRSWAEAHERLEEKL